MGQRQAIEWGDTKLRVGLYHPDEWRAAGLGDALVRAGHAVLPLPAPANGIRPWQEAGFEILVINPFQGWQDPDAFVRLAKIVAGNRPLMALSDRESVADRLIAFAAGADDAVGWTDNLPEILARIAALARRSRLAGGQFCEGELRIDLIDRRVERAGRLIRMPLREFDLLANLARMSGRPVSRDTLLRAVWRIDFDPGTNRVEVHMSRLRAKIDRDFDWPMLRTVKGRGYALVPHFE